MKAQFISSEVLSSDSESKKQKTIIGLSFDPEPDVGDIDVEASETFFGIIRTRTTLRANSQWANSLPVGSNRKVGIPSFGLSFDPRRQFDQTDLKASGTYLGII